MTPLKMKTAICISMLILENSIPICLISSWWASLLFSIEFVVCWVFQLFLEKSLFTKHNLLSKTKSLVLFYLLCHIFLADRLDSLLFVDGKAKLQARNVYHLNSFDAILDVHGFWRQNETRARGCIFPRFLATN